MFQRQCEIEDISYRSYYVLRMSTSIVVTSPETAGSTYKWIYFTELYTIDDRKKWRERERENKWPQASSTHVSDENKRYDTLFSLTEFLASDGKRPFVTPLEKP